MKKYLNTAEALKGSLREIFRVGDLVIWKTQDTEYRGSRLYHQVGRVTFINDYYMTVEFKSHSYGIQAIDVLTGRVVPLDEKHLRVYERVLSLSEKETATFFKALLEEDEQKRAAIVNQLGLHDLFGLTLSELCGAYRRFVLCSCYWSYGSKDPDSTGALEAVDAIEYVPGSASRASKQIPMHIGDSIGSLRLPGIKLEVLDTGALLSMDKDVKIGR